LLTSEVGLVAVGNREVNKIEKRGVSERCGKWERARKNRGNAFRVLEEKGNHATRANGQRRFCLEVVATMSVMNHASMHMGGKCVHEWMKGLILSSMIGRLMLQRLGGLLHDT
jgi:hypothetical protein